MSDEDRPIPSEKYAIIARHVPIVSVDLLVYHNGGLVLGKRKNEPAKDEWFVPGGSVLKGETRRQAVHRVAQEELGTDVLIDSKIGVYDHRYQTAETEGTDTKQYLATAYLVTPVSVHFQPDNQHSEFQVFDDPYPSLHDYVERYIRDLRREGVF